MGEVGHQVICRMGLYITVYPMTEWENPRRATPRIGKDQSQVCWATAIEKTALNVCGSHRELIWNSNHMPRETKAERPVRV